MLSVNEIFHSIQGESSYAGNPCIFIRLSACNLRCSYCDTEYAFYHGKKMSVDEILKEISILNCSLVEVTGGEPLLQKGTPDLLQSLLDHDYKVMLETSGSLPLDQVPAKVIKIVDIKTPGSGMVGFNLWDNLNFLNERDELKFVLMHRQDYEWAKSIAEQRQLHKKWIVHFSPAIPYLEPSVLAQWILEDKLNVRIQLQLHKILSLN